MEFWESDIADKVSKAVIFENTYLWVTFGKSFIYIHAHIFTPDSYWKHTLKGKIQ